MTTWKLETAGSYCGCYRRTDGATVFPARTMYGAAGPADFGEISRRRWKTAAAAMRAVDAMFPPAPIRLLDAVQARVVAEMANPVQRRGNVRETVASVVAAFRGRAMTAFARSAFLALVALHTAAQTGPIGDELASYGYTVNGRCDVDVSERDNGAFYAHRSGDRFHGPFATVPEALDFVGRGC